MGRARLPAGGHAARHLGRAPVGRGGAAPPRAPGRPGGDHASGRGRGRRAARAHLLPQDGAARGRRRGEHERLRLPALRGVQQRLLGGRREGAGPARRRPFPGLRAPGPLPRSEPGGGRRLPAGVPQEPRVPRACRHRPEGSGRPRARLSRRQWPGRACSRLTLPAAGDRARDTESRGSPSHAPWTSKAGGSPCRGQPHPGRRGRGVTQHLRGRLPPRPRVGRSLWSEPAVLPLNRPHRVSDGSRSFYAPAVSCTGFRGP